MTNWWKNAVLVCLFAILILPAAAQTATFRKLEDPIPLTWSSYALSANGHVMAANYGGEIFRWTANGGFEDLGTGDPYGTAIGISADGTAIISGHFGADGYTLPAIWKDGQVIELGHPKNGCNQVGNSWGTGYSLNAHGTAAVGLAWNCVGAEGFAWTAERGIWTLGHPAGHHSSRATAMSAHNETIVGFWEATTGERRAVRWVGGRHQLLFPDTTPGEASAVSSDGKVIVGQIYNDQGGAITFMHTDQDGVRRLGTINHLPTDQSFPNGISDNGIIVGWSGDPFGSGIEAYYWTQQTGMKRLSDVLKGMGARIPGGVVLTTALAISADGTTIVGQYYDSHFNFGNFMARINYGTTAKQR